MKKQLLNLFSLNLLRISLFLSTVFFATAGFSQTGGSLGFENSLIGGFLGGATTETVALDANVARTGSKSLKFTTTTTSSGKYWYTNSVYGTSASGQYVHYIYWAQSEVGAPAVDASLRYASTDPPSGTGSTANASTVVTLDNSSWQRVYFGAGNSAGRYYFPALKRTNGVSGSFFMDDFIMYVSNSSTTDILDPGAPTALTGIATNSTVNLSWTSNTDAGTGLTGVQATLILRTSNTSAATPVLNDQAQYSVAGGASGPNTIGSWTVISTSETATSTTFANTSVADGTYKYAVVLRDAAYNYSTAAVSSDVIVATVLPIKLTSFKATTQADGINLNWSTASETNTDKFIVERLAADGSALAIATIKAAGNSNKTLSYSAKDINVSPETTYYYRLKTVDLNGAIHYSEISSAKFGLVEATHSLSFYPNPVSDQLNISFSETKDNGTISITGINGKTLLKQAISKGSSGLSLDVSNLIAGVYMVQLEVSGKIQSSKFIKK